MDFSGYFRWFHANRGMLESMIQDLAKAAGLICDEKQVLGSVQARLIGLGLDADFMPALWQWKQETFRMIQAELDVLAFARWWKRERKSLAAYAKAMMSGYYTHQERKELLQEAYLKMILRVKNTRLDRVEISGLKAFVKRVIHNVFISHYRTQKRQSPFPEASGEADLPAPAEIDRLSGEEQRAVLRDQLEQRWRKVFLAREEKRALLYWVKSDFDRQAALRLMRIAGDDKKAASQYDQPLCRAKRTLFAAFYGLASIIRELDPAAAVEELKMFLLSKLGRRARSKRS